MISKYSFARETKWKERKKKRTHKQMKMNKLCSNTTEETIWYDGEKKKKHFRNKFWWIKLIQYDCLLLLYFIITSWFLSTLWVELSDNIKTTFCIIITNRNDRYVCVCVWIVLGGVYHHHHKRYMICIFMTACAASKRTFKCVCVLNCVRMRTWCVSDLNTHNNIAARVKRIQ